MKRALHLIHQDFVYTRMKGLTWIGNRGQGPQIVQNNAGLLLTQLYVETETTKPLVVNFQGINRISEYALDDLQNAIKKSSRPVIVTNGSHLRSRLVAELGDPSSEYSTIDCIAWCEVVDHEQSQDLIRESRALEFSHVKSLVHDCYCRWEIEERLHSTPLLANGVFDARQLISMPAKFAWVVMLLAERLEVALEELEEDAADNAIPSNLLAVSLRGSPIAGAVALISNRDFEVEIVDHMGPKHEILEEYSLVSTLQGVAYIYVGDFLIGGTELKTAQMYARSKGCRVTHALVIGNWLNREDYESNLGVNVQSLVDLKDCRKDAKIRFDINE